MSNTEISQVEIYKAPIRFKKVFRLSLGSLQHAPNVFVRVLTEDGQYGWGEGSAYSFISGETLEIAFTAAQEFAGILLGKSPYEIEARMRELDALAVHATTVKSAFDMAFYDLLGKRAGLPLYALLGGERRDLVSNLTMGIDTPEVMAEDAVRFKSNGARFIKTKLGGEPDLEVARIRAIREAIGAEIPIRIDANQAWDFVVAEKVLKALEPHNIQYCEQPVPHWNLEDMGRLRSATTIPIMADESLFDHHSAVRLARMEACEYFNVKLCKAGGILGALKVNAVGEAAGIKCQLGSMSESRLAMSANAHLAASRNNIAFIDLDGPLKHCEDPVVGGVELREDGSMQLPDAPGLGAELSEEFLAGLEKVSVREEPL
jgi:L-alanine-DL-glutamate epimerase-like enolase superfamily enzyme